jgi:hypothetical protein
MDYYCDEGIPYSFDIELPDLGELGMLLSPTDILEVILLLFWLKGIFKPQ